MRDAKPHESQTPVWDALYICTTIPLRVALLVVANCCMIVGRSLMLVAYTLAGISKCLGS